MNFQLKEIEYPFGTLITDDAVLVSDLIDNKLCKYELSPSEDPIWTNDELIHPRGIVVDESGLIYIASQLESPAVHIICPDTCKLINKSHLQGCACFQWFSLICRLMVSQKN